MELNIGGKEYKLRFGIGFLNELDKCYPITVENGSVVIPFYDGIQYAYTGLSQANPVALNNLIKSATCTLKTKPSNDDIEDFLNETDLLKLSESFFMSLRATNMLKLKVNSMDKQLGLRVQ